MSNVLAVIIVVRNDPAGLSVTLSGFHKPAENVHFLIWDGGSNKAALARQRGLCPPLVNFATGGPDRGVFDGMQRAVNSVDSEWVIFMNAGDRFANESALPELIECARTTSADVIYGNHRVIYPNGRKWERRALPLKLLDRRMVFCHQACLTRRQWLLRYPFQPELITADFGLYHRMYRDGARFQYVDRVIAEVAAGGMSDLQRTRNIREYRATVQEVSGLTLTLRFYFFRTLVKEYLNMQLKRVLPNAIQEKLRIISHRWHSR